MSESRKETRRAAKKERKAKPKKPPLRERLRRRVRTRAQQAADARDNPNLLWVWTRRAFLRIWRVRGGGFYGLGFAVTFVILQVQSILQDATEAESALDFVTAQIFESVVRFLSDTIVNFLQSFLWPLLFLDQTGSWGLLILLLAFLIVDRRVKPWINAVMAVEEEEEARDNARYEALAAAPDPLESPTSDGADSSERPSG